MVIGRRRKDEDFKAVPSGNAWVYGSSSRRKESLRKDRGFIKSEGITTCVRFRLMSC